MNALFYEIFAGVVFRRLFILAAVVAVIVAIVRRHRKDNADRFTAEERARKEEEMEAFRRSVR